MLDAPQQRSALLAMFGEDGRGLTLLEGLRHSTISEWTFGVLSAPVTALWQALKTADRRWDLERT